MASGWPTPVTIGGTFEFLKIIVGPGEGNNGNNDRKSLLRGVRVGNTVAGRPMARPLGRRPRPPFG